MSPERARHLCPAPRPYWTRSTKCRIPEFLSRSFTARGIIRVNRPRALPWALKFHPFGAQPTFQRLLAIPLIPASFSPTHPIICPPRRSPDTSPHHLSAGVDEFMRIFPVVAMHINPISQCGGRRPLQKLE
jgi:hypothetical protein